MQTCPVRVLLTGCATALLLVTGCDVGTASGDEPYGTNDVLRVFRSSGIHLESQRLEDGSTFVICDECGESFDVSMGRADATLPCVSLPEARPGGFERVGSLRSPTSPWTICSRPSFAMR
jgi:hypothetical protein